MGPSLLRSNSLSAYSPPAPRGPFGRKEPVGGDDVPGGHLAHQEVVAVDVEGVAVQAGLGAVEPGAELTGEDLVAQALGGAYVLLAGGERNPVPRGGGGGPALRRDRPGSGGNGRGEGKGQHGHGSLRGRISRAAAGPPLECGGPAPYFFRDRLDLT